MTLNEMIFKRKSCRSFTNAPVDAVTIETIKAFPMKALYPEINVHWDIVPRNQVKCIRYVATDNPVAYVQALEPTC